MPKVPGNTARSLPPPTDCQAAGLLLVCAVVVYWRLLVPGTAPYSPFSDFLAFHLEIKQALYQSLARAELPLWRTDQMLGGPLLTQPQAALLHPLQFLFLLIEPVRALGPTLFVALWLGGLGAYIFARTLACSWASALLAGIAQLVCFKLIIACYAGWLTVLTGLVMLPWVAAALFRLARAPDLAGWLALSVTLTISLSGGVPQTLYYLLLMLAAFGPVTAYRQHAPNLRPALRQLTLLWLALSVALACTAYLWLPVAADFSLTSRRQQSYAFFLSGHALSLSSLGTWFTPELWGTPLDGNYPGVELWEDVAYFGLLPFLGVLFAMVCIQRVDGRARWLLASFALSAALSLDTLLLKVAHHTVPGFALFRLPNRMLFVTAVLGIALFAVSADHVFDRLRRYSSRAVPYVWTCCALMMLAEGYVYAQQYLQTVNIAHLHAPARHPARGLSQPGAARGVIVGRTSFNYGWASDVGLDVANAYDSYHFWYVRDYLQLVADGRLSDVSPGPFLDVPRVARPDLLRDLAVEYVLSRRRLTDPAYSLLQASENVRNFVFYRGEHDAPLYVYRLREPRPRARFADRVHGVSSLGEVAAHLAHEHGTGQAYITEVPRAPADREEQAEDRLEETARSAGRIGLRSRTRGTRLIVLSELFHPGWRARIDGVEVRPLQTNLTLLGVWVPEGAHDIDLRFWPSYFSFALVLSALGTLTLLLASIALWRRGAGLLPASRAFRQTGRP